MSGHGNSTKAILYAFLANLGIAIIKSAAAIYTGSGSMMAEAIHSFADTGNQMLLFLGVKQTKKAADKKHPLGYGKAIYFWSFIVAILLFSLGGLFSIYEGIHKLHPAEDTDIHSMPLALIVLGLSVVLEGGSLLGAIREIKKRKGKVSFVKWLFNTSDADLVVVFGEDVAAIVGLSLAFLFILIAYLTGNLIFDAIGSIVIGGILLLVSLFVAARIQAMLIGVAADDSIEESFHSIFHEDQRILQVFRLLTLQLGPDIMIAAKVEIDPALSVKEAAEAVNEMERKIKSVHANVRWIFVEPDISD